MFPAALSDSVVIFVPSFPSGSRSAARSPFASCRRERIGATDDLADLLRDFGLASLVGLKAEEEEKTEAAATAEPEVIKKGKKEAEGAAPAPAAGEKAKKK